ncbi:hypothetical protein KEM56_000453 [Ascosphaera pollenicola]|nr:hypothetical protein KEM56_000453 [Ascosphaera pollenicola]
MAPSLHDGHRSPSEGNYVDDSSSDSDGDIGNNPENRLAFLNEERSTMKMHLSSKIDTVEQRRIHRRIQLLDEEIESVTKELSRAKANAAGNGPSPIASANPSKSTKHNDESLRTKRIKDLQTALDRDEFPSSREEDELLQRVLERLKLEDEQKQAGFDTGRKPSNRGSQTPAQPARLYDAQEQMVQAMIDALDKRKRERQQRKKQKMENEIREKLWHEALAREKQSARNPLPSPERSESIAEQPRQKTKKRAGGTSELAHYEGYESSETSSDVGLDRRYKLRNPDPGEGQRIHEHPRTRQPAVKRPVFYKVHRRDVEMESLNAYNIDFCMHDNP